MSKTKNANENQAASAPDKTKKRRIPLILFLCVVVAAVGFYAYKIWQDRRSPVEYQTIEVSIQNIQNTVSATGNVSAKDDISLYVNTTQKVKTVHVKVGDPVSVGQPLIDYDISRELKSLERKLAIAKINLQNAELNSQSIALPASGNELLQYNADISTAQKSVTDSENEIKSKQSKINQQQIKIDDANTLLEKNAALLEEGFLTQDEYDQSLSAQKNALEVLTDLQLQKEREEQNLDLRKRQLTDAQKKLDNAKNKLADEANAVRYEQQQNVAELAKIEIAQIEDDIADLIAGTTSTVQGHVKEVFVTEGGTATRNNAVIQLSDLSVSQVKADITEYDAPQLDVGQSVLITTSGLPDKVYTGQITRIAAGSVEKEKSSETEVVVPIEITVENPDDLLKTGYTVDIEIITEQAQNALSVPMQTIFYDEGQAYVYVLRSSEGTDTETPSSQTAGATASTPAPLPVPVLTKIETGLIGDNGVVVTAGLKEGDRVVLTPSEVQ